MMLILNYRRESHGSKTPQPGPAQRKPSTDGFERYFRMSLFIIFNSGSCGNIEKEAANQ